MIYYSISNKSKQLFVKIKSPDSSRLLYYNHFYPWCTSLAFQFLNLDPSDNLFALLVFLSSLTLVFLILFRAISKYQHLYQDALLLL